MKALEHTPELLALARRVIWFEDPQTALSDPVRFLAYLMTFGTAEDVTVARRSFRPDDFRHAVENAPPGIMDERSWAYWNLVVGRDPAPPMPRRLFPE